MKVSLRKFTGMRPVVDSDLLQPGEAVLATNTLLQSGALRPISALSATVVSLTSASPVKSIYRFGQGTNSETQFWFQSTNDANWVKGPVDGDTEEKTYFTGHLAYPAKTNTSLATSAAPYPTTTRPMGLQKLSSAPSGVVSGTATDPLSTEEFVTYAVALVTDWGEVGPLSAASPVYGWRVGQTITLTLATTGVASYPGNANRTQPYTTKRIYRSATGSTGAARFLFLADVSLATTTYADTTLTANLGESAISRYWVEPPDTMVGLTAMANGILAGFTGNTVCFSEPSVPYAWPIQYQQSLDAPALGAASFDQSLVVCTNRSTYVFTGTDPAQMSSEKLALNQTCVSKRSIVETMGGVVFAAPDGLVFVGPGGARLLTEGLMTRREWSAYSPETMHAYESDNSYVCFFDTGSRQAGLIFSFGDTPTFCETDIYAGAGFRDKARDTLYLVVDGGGSTRNIVRWDKGSASSMSWLSGVMRLQASINMAVARVNATGTVTFELLADGASKHGPVAITSSLAFKLPAGYRSDRYQVRIVGTGTVRSVELADSMGAMVGE